MSRSNSHEERGRGRGGGRQVEELIRLVGRRPAVPHERATRVKEAVRSHWRGELDRRALRRRRWLGVGLATAAAMVVVVAAAIGWSRLDTLRPQAEVAGVEVLISPAWTRVSAGPSARSVRLLPDSVLTTGTEVATEGHGRVSLRLVSGPSVRLDVDTRVRLASASLLVLEQGAVYVDTHRAGGEAAGTVTIRTRYGDVRDIGTQFEVRVEDVSLRVRVREGTAVLDTQSGSHGIGRGVELELDDSGSVARRAVLPYGLAWNWLAEITPVFELEGHRLREFLDWVSRERGLRLRFEDQALLSSAEEIVLNGSIEGLSIDDALDAVLPTCRMSHRIEQGQLVIQALQDDRGAA